MRRRRQPQKFEPWQGTAAAHRRGGRGPPTARARAPDMNRRCFESCWCAPVTGAARWCSHGRLL
eukprot:3182935-Pleurochrysis_carterae.AAC.1